MVRTSSIHKGLNLELGAGLSGYREPWRQPHENPSGFQVDGRITYAFSPRFAVDLTSAFVIPMTFDLSNTLPAALEAVSAKWRPLATNHAIVLEIHPWWGMMCGWAWGVPSRSRELLSLNAGIGNTLGLFTMQAELKPSPLFLLRPSVAQAAIGFNLWAGTTRLSPNISASAYWDWEEKELMFGVAQLGVLVSPESKTLELLKRFFESARRR